MSGKTLLTSTLIARLKKRVLIQLIPVIFMTVCTHILFRNELLTSALNLTLSTCINPYSVKTE